MKKISNEQVDFYGEQQFMVDYILQTWNGDPNYLREIVEQAFCDGYHAARHWIGQSQPLMLTEKLHKFIDKRKNYLEKNNQPFEYDDIYKLNFNILLNQYSYEKEIIHSFHFEKTIHHFINQLQTDLNSRWNQQKISPKGWRQVNDSNLSAFEYFYSFSLETEKLFEGHASQSSASYGFERSSNLASVYYSVTEKGSSIFQELYSASFAHGLFIRDYNNSLNLKEDYALLMKTLDNRTFPNVTYLENLGQLSDNRILNALTIDKARLRANHPYSSQEELNAFISKNHSIEPSIAPLENVDKIYLKMVLDILNHEKIVHKKP